MREHQVVPGLQQGSTLGIGLLPPAPIGGSRGLNGRAGLGAAHVGHGADRYLCCRIDDVDRPARAGCDPFAANQASFAEETFVFQVFHRKRPCNQLSAATTAAVTASVLSLPATVPRPRAVIS